MAILVGHGLHRLDVKLNLLLSETGGGLCGEKAGMSESAKFINCALQHFGLGCYSMHCPFH